MSKGLAVMAWGMPNGVVAIAVVALAWSSPAASDETGEEETAVVAETGGMLSVLEVTVVEA